MPVKKYFFEPEVNSFLKNAEYPPVNNDATFVDFFRDGTYIMYFHNFEYGTYHLKDSLIYLNNNDTSWILLYENLEPEKDEGIFKFSYLKDDKIVASFKMRRIENYNSSSYPFNLENNRWRIKAKHKESQNEIIDRVQNHILYIENYIEWCNEEQIRLGLGSLPSPIIVAGNGYAVKEYSRLSNWCRFFYDESDCLDSFELLVKFFVSNNRIEWENGMSNRAKILVDGLGQFRKGLDEYRVQE